MEAEKHACIIGGGFAGLSAAAQFEKNNISYELLEATNRLGGRVFPYKHNGYALQLGAEYINGKNNEMYKIASKLGIISEVEPDYGIFENNPTIVSGSVKFDPEYLRIWREFVDPLEDDFIAVAEKNPKLSIGELFLAKYKEFLKTHESEKLVYDELAKTYISYYESEWSSPVDELASGNFQTWDDENNSDASFTLKGDGFGAILQELISRISLNNVHFNSVVKTIEWTSSPIRIILHSGRIVSCDVVIVTVPLGVLKENTELFQPQMDELKTKVINDLGFGKLEKIFLEYDEQWWDNNTSTIVPLPLDNATENRSFTNSLRRLEIVEGYPNTIKIWLSGTGPEAMSHMTDTDIMSNITEFLRLMLQNSTIPSPIRLIMHRWKTDPHTKGAYSYLSPSSYNHGENAYRPMAEPLKHDDKLAVCFAGEHTHPSLYQTTSGAYASGLKEADRVIEYFKSR